jgi:hypothetical protein
VDRSTDGVLRVSGSGVLFDGEPLTPPAPPPALGEHNAELPELLRRWRAGSRRPALADDAVR